MSTLKRSMEYCQDVDDGILVSSDSDHFIDLEKRFRDSVSRPGIVKVSTSAEWRFSIVNWKR
ncbi:MAG: hypothetical protein M1816_002504, partial [Peltula sp. TS41687]